ncbi:flagellar assembly protein FliH [Pollutimonas thiosulfatoxidans]|uniref:Flagellar assembly protein FliH n=1 Tax=Pollutimonas thiosulfatoxidans TaxID=2028345 RepID=A0A410G9F4_9BURK|nr:flagellar assembly protein FliH [Pollutimonas thiosulfatoxidans]QAA92948.1 hypothetical protein CKA81_03130 [Pollutimonas thiosulfatoxidans]
MSNKSNAESRAAESWQRWEMSAFDKPVKVKAAAVPATPAPDPAVLLQEVQRLRDAAKKRGHAEGYADGHAQGLEAGTLEGNKQGRQEGYEAGFSAGHSEGREQSSKEAAALHALATSAAASIGTLEADMGQALIALAIRIAEQVLRSTLDAHPEKIQDLVRDILQMEAGKEAVLHLRVNPADAELVQQCLDEDPGASKWRLITDTSINRGGCIAQTALGNIDATLQTRWQRVTSSLGHGEPSEHD